MSRCGPQRAKLDFRVQQMGILKDLKSDLKPFFVLMSDTAKHSTFQFACNETTMYSTFMFLNH